MTLVLDKIPCWVFILIEYNIETTLNGIYYIVQIKIHVDAVHTYIDFKGIYIEMYVCMYLSVTSFITLK